MYNDLNFSIFAGNTSVGNFEYRNKYNQAFEFYNKTWKRVLNRPNRPEYYSVDAFLRQSYVLQINIGPHTVAQTLCTNFNLENSITEHLSFFKNFKGNSVLRMKMDGIESILSIEYSAINRLFSPRKCENLNFYKVIFQLAVKIGTSISVDALIGHPRRVTGTNNIISEAGGVCYQEKVSMYGVNVDLYVIKPLDLKPFDQREMKIVDYLWDSRVDLTGDTFNKFKNESEQKKAG